MRSKSKDGQILVIIEHGNGIFETIDTGMHLSDQIGSGGEATDAHFSNACRYLWRECKLRFSGYPIDDDARTSLVRGDIYPGVVLNRDSNSRWIDDWWDEGQFSKSHPNYYWHGYREFCDHIYNYVENDNMLRKERDAILSGTWKPQE